MLGLLLLTLVALKLVFDPGLGRNSLDGDYYFQIARHVAEGDGLETSVSLYHQGLKSLPHPTNASPLWPLTMGLAARPLGLDWAARSLPELLYLASLVLLYALGRRLESALAQAPEAAAPERALDLGHAAVLVFGLNPVFFEFTSLPYTEGLAFLLVFATLLVADLAARRASVPLAAVAGVAAGLAFLTRAQAVGLVAGLLAAFALVGFRSRRQWLLGAVAAVAAFAVVVPWALFLAGWMEPFRLKAMIAVGAYRETPEVAPFAPLVTAASLGEWVWSRLGGLLTAFAPFDRDAYTASFGPVVYALPIGLVAALAGLGRGVARRLRPDAFLPLATTLAGLAMLAPVHNTQSTFFREWLFGFRHGLPLILPLLAALALLLAARAAAVRVTAVALVASSVLMGAFGVADLLVGSFPSGLLGPEPRLVEWLDAQKPRPAVVTTNAQALSVFSRAGFHWTECNESAEKTMALIEHAGADYVLVYPGQERCPFLAGLETELGVAERFSDHRFEVVVLAPRERAALD